MLLSKTKNTIGLSIASLMKERRGRERGEEEEKEWEGVSEGKEGVRGEGGMGEARKNYQYYE